jgi:hypothetical protein
VQEVKAGAIKYFQFASFNQQGLYHAIFTRQGGTSQAPWQSLNFGSTVGDDLNHVRQNKELAFQSIGIELTSIYDVYQVHSTEVVQTDRPLKNIEPHKKADAIITNQPGVTLLMRFADCVPIMLFDPIHHAIGIAHAGWIGTVNKIGQQVVRAMKSSFGTKPAQLIAAIGPSIGPDHYQVGLDVIGRVNASFEKDAQLLVCERDGKKYLDLWKTNELILWEEGVEHIEVAGMCTQCSLTDWYSHRGEHGKTGRFGALVGLY